MKIYCNTNNNQNIIRTQKQIKINTRTSAYHKTPNFGSAINQVFELPKRVKISLFVQKQLAKIVGQKSNILYYELKSLEGLQEGIEAFKGLSLKEIAFVGDNLHSITAKRGCYSHCAYCYPGAEKPIKPVKNFINEILFEDLEATADAFKTLKKRSGINFIHNDSNRAYTTMVHDADNIEIGIKDSLGKVHEFPEINKIRFDATGTPGIFDTCGWNTASKRHQERAERIVEYYSKEKNLDELIQFNISINPFHSSLLKVNELKENGKIDLAKKIYEKHIDRLANALFTCIPISESKKFGIIKRAFGWEVPNMQGFYFTDELKILNDVYKKFSKLCVNDYKTTQKYIKDPHQLNNIELRFMKKLEQHGEVIELNKVEIDTELIAATKLKNLIKSKNPDMTDSQFYELFPNVLENKGRFENMEQFKKYRAAHTKYLKIIDANGKVYLTDAYRVIPTDIQLNFKNKDKETAPFKTMVEDFVLTKKMI